MDWQSAALAVAGVIGSTVAVVHGILTQRLMVRPFEQLALADGRVSAPIRRLVPLLLHFSTVAWFLGRAGPDRRRKLVRAATLRLATGLFVGSLYLYGALGNFWGTRGRHPGWMLMAAALVLIAYGLTGQGA